MIRKIAPYAPAVFVAGDHYQIMTIVDCPATVRIQVGEESFYDHCGGVLRSHVRVHRVKIPQEKLDAAGEYTIYYRKILDRKPYFPTSEPELSQSYSFRPVKSGKVQAYHLADIHGFADKAITAAQTFTQNYGEIDFLILNGGHVLYVERPESLDVVYRIADQLTHGEIPIVCSRGNHDMRGDYAEITDEYLPNIGGNYHYTLRLGDLWALVLDCGEDKVDHDAEYGHLVCSADARREETSFINRVIERADVEYMGNNVRQKLVIAHSSFTFMPHESGYDIDRALFTEWSSLIRNQIGADLMISGGLWREQRVLYPGDFTERIPHPCPILLGSDLNYNPPVVSGTGIIFGDMVEVVFTNSNRQILGHQIIDV